MVFKTGIIYHFTPCMVSDPVKNKYAICISGKNNWFYLINSCSDVPPIRPYKFEEGRVVFLNSFQVSTLNKKSYVNVSKLKTITSADYDLCRECEKVSNMVWLSVKKLCIETLPPQYCSAISGEKIT